MFLNYKDLSSREAYEYYRENRKSTSKNIDQYNYFKKAVEGILILLSDKIINNQEGVCIRDLGYFCMIKNKYKTGTINPMSKSILKKNIKKYKYKPYMFPDVMYDNWHMENAFTKNFKRNFKKAHNKDYKIRKTICDSIIVNEDFIQKTLKTTNTERLKNYKKEARK